MSKLKAFELKSQLVEWSKKNVTDFDAKQWAEKSAYMALKRNAFGEFPEAKERKARFGRI